MPKVEAVVLLSGGVDSSVTLAHAVHLWGSQHVAALFIDYGQRPRAEEESAAAALCKDAGVGIFAPLAVPLLYDQQHPMLEAAGALPTWEATELPYRNGVLFSIGAARALAVGACELWVGAVPPIPNAFAFADATHAWLDHQARAVSEGTRHRVSLRRPLMDVAWYPEIIQRGVRMGVKFENTYSCFVEKGPCGKCPKCKSRERAFRDAGVP